MRFHSPTSPVPNSNSVPGSFPGGYTPPRQIETIANHRLAQVLDAAVSSQCQIAVLGILAVPECGDTPEVKRLCDVYRNAAVRIPNALSLR